MSTEIELAVTHDPSIVLIDKEKREDSLAHIRREVESHVPDLTTDKGRKAIAIRRSAIYRLKGRGGRPRRTGPAPRRVGSPRQSGRGSGETISRQLIGRLVGVHGTIGSTQSVQHFTEPYAALQRYLQYAQNLAKRNFAEELRSLQRHYMLLNSSGSIIELLEEKPAVYALLIEAVKPLQNAFGEKRFLHARVQSSDEARLVKVEVQLPGDFGGDPERALCSFDEDWWLYNCHRAGGALVFDYEMQDAI